MPDNNPGEPPRDLLPGKYLLGGALAGLSLGEMPVGFGPMRAKPSHLAAAAVAVIVVIVGAVTLGINLARNDIRSAPQAGVSTPVSGLPTIKAQDLPQEATATLELIDRGGPFPYKQDGTTFRNQENLLPKQATGYYREYTVKTPGEDDRGTRRIIVGHDGDVYYTADHYESFRQVLR